MNIEKETGESDDKRRVLRKCLEFKWHVYGLKLFHFLEKPKTTLSIFYHTFILLLILMSVNLSVLSTTMLSEKLNTQSHTFELVLSMLFAGEFAIRFFLCGEVVNYRGFSGKIRFLTSIYAIIDLLVITSALWELFSSGNSDGSSAFKILRFSRFFQICRVFRLDRKNGNLLIMWQTVRIHKKELLTCYFICFNILFIGAYVIYVVEKPGDNHDKENNHTEEKITNMADSLYWGIITFTSVGYGDFAPQTWAGKALTGLFSILGCAFFSLPAGIIGSGFALQVSKQKKAQRYLKVRNPAAIVIQTAWRNYAVNEHTISQATWYYLFPQLSHTRTNTCAKIQRPYAPNVTSPNNLVSSSNESVDAGKERSRSVRRVHESDDMRKRSVFPFFNIKRDLEKSKSNLSVRLSSEGNPMSGSFVSATTLYGICDLLDGMPEIVMNNIPIGNLILKKYKNLVRFILIIKLEWTITSFKNIRQPYVNVELMMQRNNVNTSEALHTLRITVSQLSKINAEITIIKNELRDIKRYIKNGSSNV